MRPKLHKSYLVPFGNIIRSQNNIKIIELSQCELYYSSNDHQKYFQNLMERSHPKQKIQLINTNHRIMAQAARAIISPITRGV